ncbi:hypothetical protein T492DRAFT_22292 [Pavlovales sp. CCMP2436]|nr:hypothetical protein T492DRAFT_22292 [Pavlovales sp. CCMP2436]
MATGWSPSPEGLLQLLNLFRTSATANNDQHREIQQQLVNFNSIADYNNYLVYILSSLRDENPSVRQMAGLVRPARRGPGAARATPGPSTAREPTPSPNVSRP